jgi:DNA-binding beta-propeller fold protein YncE
MNDSVSLIDIASGRVVAEQDLRPGIIDPRRRGQPGGSYPRTVGWTAAHRAYVASERDREIISLSISRDKIRVVHRLPVQGQPVALLANLNGSRVYVALDTTGQVAIFDTARDKLIESLDVVAPKSVYTNSRMLGGANTNALALTPDERTLLVSNGGENAIAVVALSDAARGAVAPKPGGSGSDEDDRGTKHSEVVGLVPTGWYPSGLAMSKDGTTWYVVNGKNPTGPNVSWCKEPDPVRKICVTKDGSAGGPASENQLLEQLEKASLLSLPAPSRMELARLTRQAARNNRFDQPDKTAADERKFSFLREHIKHVLYIIKENRTYDQVLGDLEVGDGDPRFTLFPEKLSPNHHAIARRFVDLDNTLVSGEGSPQGWTWTYAAQDTDYNERNEPHSYEGRGVQFDGFGDNRNINMGYATSEERHDEFPLSPSDPNILPGVRDVNAPDGPDGMEGKGYLWDAALRKGLTVRNWGLAPDPQWWLGWIASDLGPVAPGVREPYTQKQRVFWTSKASLMPYSDPYYRPHFVAYPDYWRAKEWKREFAEFSAAKSAPNLMLMWLPNDHFGCFEKALDGVNTPETQMADNDYALGEIVEAVANSPFAKDTLIFSIEDDSWDGSDHVEAHRTVALVVGPYVRQHAVVSTHYTTVSMVKTIEEILGIGPIGLNDALAAPMSDIFDPNQETWSFKAIVPNVLRSTQLPLPPDEHARIEYPKHTAAYWARAMADQDFSGPDRINPVTFNRALWRGLKGDAPLPAKPMRVDLRANRAQLLAQTKPTKKQVR